MSPKMVLNPPSPENGPQFHLLRKNTYYKDNAEGIYVLGRGGREGGLQEFKYYLQRKNR